jgi:hypothetical protein
LVGAKPSSKIESNSLLAKSLHNTLRQIGYLLDGWLSDGTLEDCTLEFRRLDELVDHIEGAEREQLLEISVFVLYFLVEYVLNSCAHETLGVVGPMLLIDYQKFD